MRRPSRPIATLAALLLAASVSGAQEPRRLRIVHTNDLQSRLLGFAPNPDYTPLTTGDDATIGGIARLATVVRTLRDEAPGSTLVLDGGDVMMGTLFQTLAQSEGTELRLLGALGYDAAVLGNHEFDFRSGGLARIVEAARAKTLAEAALPRLVLSNIRFDPQDPGDDELARLFEGGVIRRRLVIERGGLRIGLFGLMGVAAAKLSPYAHPARFEDPIAAAESAVAALREEDGVDLVVCLSHGGVRRQRDGTWGGEDVELARRVAGIDVVVGGHSHTPLPEPILVGGTPVLQAGGEGRYVGVLDLEVAGGKARVADYRLIAIDDSIAAALDVHHQVEHSQRLIDERVLAPYAVAFTDPVVETAFDLTLDESSYETLSAGNLGPLVADALRAGIERRAGPTDVALAAAGLIRDEILRGERGVQQISDLFRVLALGIGSVDDSPGYPLTRSYLTARELKNVLEIMTLAHAVKGSNHFPYFSGIRFRYNPRRIPLDRVFEIEIGDAERGYAPIDLTSSNPRLYSVAMNAYVLSFVGLVEELSYGLLHVTLKDAAGAPLTDLDAALVDVDPGAPGVQEAKEWTALLDFARSFPDLDGNGIPDVPARYRDAEPRMIAVASWSPRLLLKNATWRMWTATLVPLALLGAAGWFLARRWRRSSRS